MNHKNLTKHMQEEANKRAKWAVLNNQPLVAFTEDDLNTLIADTITATLEAERKRIEKWFAEYQNEIPCNVNYPTPGHLLLALKSDNADSK